MRVCFTESTISVYSASVTRAGQVCAVCISVTSRRQFLYFLFATDTAASSWQHTGVDFLVDLQQKVAPGQCRLSRSLRILSET